MILLLPVTGLVSAAPEAGPGVAGDAGAPQGNDAGYWLKRMGKAANTLNYHGRYILLNSSQLVPVEYRHAVVDGERWEHTAHLDGERAEIIRKGSRVSYLHPDAFGFLQHTGGKDSFAPSLHERLDQMHIVYDVQVSRQGRVAGRSARRIDVIPLDRTRYGYHLWVDEETGLLLKSVTLDDRGDTLELFEYISINVGQPVDEALFEAGEGVQWVDMNSLQEQGLEQAALLPHWDWEPRWMPAGFDVARQEVKYMNGSPVSTRVYSDGMAAFTVFLAPDNASSIVDGAIRRGATVAVSRYMTTPDQNYLVTIVGEIPAKTAVQVVESVQKTEY